MRVSGFGIDNLCSWSIMDMSIHAMFSAEVSVVPPAGSQADVS